MSGVVNLNRARKARARAEARATAAENRAAHGRTKAEKALAEARALKAGRDLDGARREN
ncbi:MAG: DUF4169 family protein [Pseudomonadota bacterium]